MADTHKTTASTVAHAGAAVIEKVAEKTDSWALKMLGVGLGIFTGSFATDLGSQFSKKDEHQFHKLMTRLKEEDAKNKTDDAAVLLFFLEKAFPRPGLGFNQIINVFQNNFRNYVAKHATVAKPGEKDLVYIEDNAMNFLRDEIINPIKNDAKGRNAGYKKVIRNFTALDVPLPPHGIDKIVKNLEKSVQARAEAARAAKADRKIWHNPVHWFLDKTKII